MSYHPFERHGRTYVATITEHEDSTTISTVEADTTARVMGLTPADIEEALVEQLAEMVADDTTQGLIRVMPDTHPGAGAVIGFTMPIDGHDTLRVCPNTVGVDIGCGMLAFRLDVDRDELDVEAADEAIREAVPLGHHVHDDPGFHFADFPWEDCQANWESTRDTLGLSDPDFFEGYDLETYFKPLCARVGYSEMRAINSMGTLGGGNHFIELTLDDEDSPWVVLHSGSRGIGKAIAEYWQAEAVRRRTNEWIRNQLPEELEAYVVPDLDDPELTDWFQGGKGQSYIDSDSIRDAVDDNYLIGYLHDSVREAHPDRRRANEDLDALVDQEAAGYLVDMIFAQRYAWENRRRMGELIADALDAEIAERVHSPHNLVDFDDHVLRKGATRAHEGERFVLPFNMADGTFICEGVGNDNWNHSAPHGAGRVMSRGQAFDELDMDEFEAKMTDIHSTSVTEETLDESPMAYKDAALIQEAIGPTADIVHNLEPALNIKAED